MTEREFKIIDGMLSEGLDNSRCLMVKDVNTEPYLGYSPDIRLDGVWLVVYTRKDDDYFAYLDVKEAKYKLDWSDEEYLYLFELND